MILPRANWGRSIGGLFIPTMPPKLNSFHDVTCGVAGGVQITCRGRCFRNGSRVTFGGVDGTSVTFIDETEIRVNAPAHGAGVVDVVVISPNGLGSSTISGGFTYSAPATVTISGTQRQGVIGIPGGKVYIYNDLGGGVKGSQVAGSPFTPDANGQYSTGTLANGAYIVECDPPPGYAMAGATREFSVPISGSTSVTQNLDLAAPYITELFNYASTAAMLNTATGAFGSSKPGIGGASLWIDSASPGPQWSFNELDPTGGPAGGPCYRHRIIDAGRNCNGGTIGCFATPGSKVFSTMYVSWMDKFSDGTGGFNPWIAGDSVATEPTNQPAGTNGPCDGSAHEYKHHLLGMKLLNNNGGHGIDLYTGWAGGSTFSDYMSVWDELNAGTLFGTSGGIIPGCTYPCSSCNCGYSRGSAEHRGVWHKWWIKWTGIGSGTTVAELWVDGNHKWTIQGATTNLSGRMHNWHPVGANYNSNPRDGTVGFTQARWVADYMISDTPLALRSTY